MKAEKIGRFHQPGRITWIIDDAGLAAKIGVSTLELGQLVELEDGNLAVQFDRVNVDGKAIHPVVKIAGRPSLAKAVEDADLLDRQEAERSDFPGLAEIRAAMAAEENYSLGFGRMMESEANDGRRAPRQPEVSAAELAERYPLAVLYLRAESYSNASNFRKAAAGRRAMDLLRAGREQAQAEASDVLANWLHDGAMVD